MQLSPVYRAFEASDDWIIVDAFTDRMWEGVCRATGRTELIEDPQFRTGADRGKHRLYLIDQLSAAFRQRTVAEWVVLLHAEDAPSTPVNSIDQVVVNEQVLARDMVVAVDHPVAGQIHMAGLPIKLSETPGAVHTAASLLGQHSEEILASLSLLSSAGQTWSAFLSGSLPPGGGGNIDDALPPFADRVVAYLHPRECD